ncbi:MAG: hypothetical protein ACRDTM_01480 [Micromonosporaceae bacterium]
MEYAKLDPTLAAEVGGGEPGQQLPVFVHVADELDAASAERLASRLGLERPVAPGSVLSMTVSAERVGELSDQPWVVAIRAARRLRPLH